MQPPIHYQRQRNASNATSLSHPLSTCFPSPLRLPLIPAAGEQQRRTRKVLQQQPAPGSLGNKLPTLCTTSPQPQFSDSYYQLQYGTGGLTLPTSSNQRRRHGGSGRRSNNSSADSTSHHKFQSSIYPPPHHHQPSQPPPHPHTFQPFGQTQPLSIHAHYTQNKILNPSLRVQRKLQHEMKRTQEFVSVNASSDQQLDDKHEWQEEEKQMDTELAAEPEKQTTDTTDSEPRHRQRIELATQTSFPDLHAALNPSSPSAPTFPTPTPTQLLYIHHYLLSQHCILITPAMKDCLNERHLYLLCHFSTTHPKDIVPTLKLMNRYYKKLRNSVFTTVQLLAKGIHTFSIVPVTYIHECLTFLYSKPMRQHLSEEIYSQLQTVGQMYDMMVQTQSQVDTIQCVQAVCLQQQRTIHSYEHLIQLLRAEHSVPLLLGERQALLSYLCGEQCQVLQIPLTMDDINLIYECTDSSLQTLQYVEQLQADHQKYSTVEALIVALQWKHRVKQYQQLTTYGMVEDRKEILQLLQHWPSLNIQTLSDSEISPIIDTLIAIYNNNTAHTLATIQSLLEAHRDIESLVELHTHLQHLRTVGNEQCTEIVQWMNENEVLQSTRSYGEDSNMKILYTMEDAQYLYYQSSWLNHTLQLLHSHYTTPTDNNNDQPSPSYTTIDELIWNLRHAHYQHQQLQLQQLSIQQQQFKAYLVQLCKWRLMLYSQSSKSAHLQQLHFLPLQLVEGMTVEQLQALSSTTSHNIQHLLLHLQQLYLQHQHYTTFDTLLYAVRRAVLNAKLKELPLIEQWLIVHQHELSDVKSNEPVVVRQNARELYYSSLTGSLTLTYLLSIHC